MCQVHLVINETCPAGTTLNDARPTSATASIGPITLVKDTPQIAHHCNRRASNVQNVGYVREHVKALYLTDFYLPHDSCYYDTVSWHWCKALVPCLYVLVPVMCLFYVRGANATTDHSQTFVFVRYARGMYIHGHYWR